MPLNEQPNNKVDAPSAHKDGVTDPSADLSPEEIKRFYNSLNTLLNQASDIFFKQAHFWPKHVTADVDHPVNDYQLVLHRYKGALANHSSFCLNPNRAVYKEQLEPLRERIADKSDLDNMRATARKYLNAKQAIKDGYPEPEPKLMRMAADWIDKVDKLTADFSARVDAMYPPGQAEGKTA